MASNSLEERLRNNSNAFDGLLALIPAKYYYDEKTQDQWKAKKKSKKQSKEDKVKKLDPENSGSGDEGVTALDAKIQRDKDAKPVVLPGEKFKMQKIKAARDQEKKEQKEQEHELELEQEGDEELDVVFDDEGNEVQDSVAATLQTQIQAKEEKTQEFEAVKSQKQQQIEALRAKLQNKIKEMKQKRKAPGSNVQGAPSSREAILLQRKRKLDTKKSKKDQQAQEADSDASNSSDDDDVNGDIDNDIVLPNKKTKLDGDLTKDIMFQNIVFDDGDKATSDLQRIRKATKKNGPSRNDFRAHLKILETKKSKLESKDELDQIRLKEKEKWQKTMLQAEGVKLKNDEKMLRKAIKKKESKKRKSANEWNERKRAVEATISERTKRREENLQIRKDNKNKKRSKQQKMKRKYTGSVKPNLPKKQKRAGFEGSLKSSKKK
ncbi:hypothetical protein TPHA_0N01670 [Tetrapisispora phaffii CBS 4417]|uniref:Ribosomal RNA-processing protein 14/surfeit locus protein 6 C-terminal domain-containing protein n=1 Tax=Tetrapisispora phaffii (strain ATCC 24235 / CBS 4417 / NBRC 1672 / NRRL Y-8282 / UCD 70-5) TaxID=1071381 RepID=G8C1C0_TETPH|nr:hypothetical protein TPHA_0N01670 [Tetrapisispora phaffii CBS 4417]CCE65948.1 hypothetical protein TPHA_0N01670 [Tetrapisispora phaffii CBS 4417]